MNCNQIGTVEILKSRVYPIVDNCGDSPTAIIEPGIFPLYQEGEMKFWILEGKMNRKNRKIGDGIFTISQSDISSDIVLRFPSRAFTPKEWKEFIKESVTIDGHPDQRLKIAENL